jgi:catalase
VVGNKGSADLARDVRGFAVKFYTKEGNWDLVGNNIPVFFIQDAMKFPDLVHSVKDEPDRGFPQAASAHDNFWDFVSLMPETTHMLMWVMSDRAIPRSFRFMEGFGVHTFRFVNGAGESNFVKFHWKPKLGMQSVVSGSSSSHPPPTSSTGPSDRRKPAAVLEARPKKQKIHHTTYGFQPQPRTCRRDLSTRPSPTAAMVCFDHR